MLGCGGEGVLECDWLIVEILDGEFRDRLEDGAVGQLRNLKFDIHLWKLKDLYYYLNAFLRNLQELVRIPSTNPLRQASPLLLKPLLPTSARIATLWYIIERYLPLFHSLDMYQDEVVWWGRMEYDGGWIIGY